MSESSETIWSAKEGRTPPEPHDGGVPILNSDDEAFARALRGDRRTPEQRKQESLARVKATNFTAEQQLLHRQHQIEVAESRLREMRVERLLELQRDIHSALGAGVTEEELEGISELVDEALVDLNSNLYKIGSNE